MVQWAENFRKLSKESSNGGRFVTAKVEVARGPMLWATEPGVSKITLMACTQLLKTTVIENIIGRFVHLDPCPILAVLPKDDAAENFSKDRLAPMIRDSKKLLELFGEAKARDAGATLTHKQFPGGHITLVGANSPTNLAMRPIRLLVCDEIDKYPLSAGGEGPPIDLAEERQAEFKANSLTVLACSPSRDTLGMLDNVQGTFVRINDTADKVQTGLGYVTSIVGFLVEHKTLVFVGLGLFLVVKAAGYVLDGWIKVRTAFF